MLHVPRMIDACPGRETPEPSALDTTSINPPLTGVPSASPQAARAVTRPAMSDGPISRGSFSRASSRP